jgi:hypothetical protein
VRPPAVRCPKYVREEFAAYLKCGDPESKVSNGNPRGLMHAANKLNYWDLFEDLYLVVTSHQPGALPPQFLDELTRAYELEASRAASAAASRVNPSSASAARPLRDCRTRRAYS